MSDNTVLDATAIAAAVSAIIKLFVKPLIEVLPFANPTSKAQYNVAAHDALIRGASFVLNVAGVLFLAAWYNQLSLANWQTLALQIIAQSFGSHGFYAIMKSSAMTEPAPVAPAMPVNVTVDGKQVATALLNSLPILRRAPVVPAPTLTAPSAPSPASVAATSAAAVASAVNQAIAAQTS